MKFRNKMKRNADINSILRPLSETVSQAYISNALQVADVLEWIIQQRNCLGGYIYKTAPSKRQ